MLTTVSLQSAPAAAAPLPEVDGGRGDLLASIRQGKKLRKAADRKKEEDKAPAKHGGDWVLRRWR